MRRGVWLLILLIAALWAPGAASARGLSIGFDDPHVGFGYAPSTSQAWIERARGEGAGFARLTIAWSVVAPAVKPAGFDATNPASPGYNWGALDAALRALEGTRLKPLVTLYLAPAWAQGAHRPRSAPNGTWKPSAKEFGRFALAAARRYSGRYPDPLRPGRTLPRVRYWQAWNEPNLDVYLNPQWRRLRHGWTAESPVIYRKLLNALYKSVKRVSRSNFVVTAGTAPYGDAPGGERVPPVTFDRALLCLRGDRHLRPVRCGTPAHFDALSHHPYGIGGPLWHAVNSNDVAVPDLGKLTRLLRAAERYHHVLPRGRKHLWVTEISWDSKPPDPHGYPIAEQARWYEQALYVLWRQGVDHVFWLQLVDAPPVPSYAASSQGGLYYLNWQAKPSALAVRFPFVADRPRRGRAALIAWGRAPKSGELSIQERRGRHWRTVRRIKVHGGRIFESRLAAGGKVELRARVAGLTSLSWSQGA